MSARGFSSCRSGHMSGVWIHMAAISSTMQTWHLDLTTPRLAYPFSFTCAPPTCRAPTTSPNKDDLNAKPPGTSDGSGDADEHDVVHQDHVSATPSTVTNESLAGPLSPIALTLRHFASRLCACLCVPVCLSLSLCLCLTYFDMSVTMQALPNITVHALLCQLQKRLSSRTLRDPGSQRSQECVCLCSQQHSFQLGLHRPTPCGLHCPLAASVATKSRSRLVPSPPSLPPVSKTNGRTAIP